MAEKKQDVRVTKTQRSISEALLALLRDRSFSKITINDICEEAMVSRSTFYSHFEDKYRLLKFCMEELQSRLFRDFHDKDLRLLLLTLLENIKANEKTLRNLLVAELDFELVEMFRCQFIGIFKSRICEHSFEEVQLDARLEVIATFYAAGVSQTIALWIAKRLPMSTEDMADTLCELLEGLKSCTV